MSALSFRSVSSGSSKFSPRLGLLTFTREEVEPVIDGAAPPTSPPSLASCRIEVQTPGVLSCTTRGVIPHLSRDNVRRLGACLKWVHVPFESFLQIDPPIPILQRGAHPLHTFLGFPPSQTIVSMSLRDLADPREMPANGKQFVAAQSARGMRKVTCPTYQTYTSTTQPDIVFPLTDTPFTPPPHSQKRISKSIERSRQWLASILAREALGISTHNRPVVFLPMAGGVKPAARKAFADALQEPLEQKEREALELQTLDDGVAGYVFDLLPLRMGLLAEEGVSPRETLESLIRASLTNLPATKPRLATIAESPHEVLKLVRDAGVDLFDTNWAQQAADYGVALDFVFPALGTGIRDVGYNLYDERYGGDFQRLGMQVGLCECAACSPVWTDTPLVHSSVDDTPQLRPQSPQRASGYSRAYVHHLLHTHEMSAHALLVMHNIAVVDRFMQGIREVLGHGVEIFEKEVARFEEEYEGTMRVMSEAKIRWKEVDLARGKGRFAREKAHKDVED